MMPMRSKISSMQWSARPASSLWTRPWDKTTSAMLSHEVGKWRWIAWCPGGKTMKTSSSHLNQVSWRSIVLRCSSAGRIVQLSLKPASSSTSRRRKASKESLAGSTSIFTSVSWRKTRRKSSVSWSQCVATIKSSSLRRPVKTMR